MKPLFIFQRFGIAGGRVQPGAAYVPSVWDLRCLNASGGTLAGADTGCDWVDFDLAKLADGVVPRIVKAPVNALAAGCVRVGQGTIADGAECWVRVYGPHDYAKVDGTTDVAIGDYLGVHGSTAGAAAKDTTLGDRIARALEVRTADSIGAVKVLVLNALGLPLA